MRLILPLLFLPLAMTAQNPRIERRVDSLLRLMTLEEKVGQLNQYSGDWAHTGPITREGDKQEQVRRGQVGSVLNVIGVEHTRQLQEMALQSKRRIPLLFAQDVIHGFKTTFPIPLAEAASWDTAAIRLAARVAAVEAAAAGIHWTFAPMVDIARDPRWGRIMEGAGEDPWLGSLIATARVKGFQGRGLGHTDAVMACAKHFIAYGAAVGGRDYNSVDMSMRQLYETYLPPFKAALDAGVATFMNSFNDLNGVPATGHAWLQRTLLKGSWKFTGFMVSDWGSIGEMIQHGYVHDNKEAAASAILAGSDMDMESRSYRDHLATLVREGKVKISVVDDAVRRILRKKFELGLFEDPFRFSNPEREKQLLGHPDHRAAARDMARKSIVLLKNDNQVLPLRDSYKKVAFIGPFVKAVRDNLGFWSMEWPDDSSTIVTQWAGLEKRWGSRLHYAKGCNINDSSRAGFEEALTLARGSDLVILSLGEARDMSGEAKSRSRLRLPGVQEELLKAVCATGKPIVLLVNAGRPLIFPVELPSAIVYTWWLGTEAGHAIADVLSGDHNPSAKLPVTFPRHEGQIPIYYNHYNTGRPARNDSDKLYRSAYLDESLYPLFPFGYGLSYTKFSYSPILLSDTAFRAGGSLTASVTVTNTGDYDGEETVQLYMRDLVGSVVRPVKELKGFQKVFLKKGESRELQFRITANDLRFYNDRLEYRSEPGEFLLFIGGSSDLRDGVRFILQR